ncbi:transcription factor SOX-8 [Platysternon megacephalum]|uniref:Transcription factor SOX-8 n=1 Tax=Platysternon megacephalum TaxID=55544 RepID=A0A4D9EJM5_9SAUR|nr:transcription factor SOX-8 [Platysternon megacephalum]
MRPLCSEECIQEVINTNQQKPWDTYSRSIGQVDLLPFPKLQKNFQLCRIVEKFLAPLSKEACWPEEKPAATKAGGREISVKLETPPQSSFLATLHGAREERLRI